jgi:hypothetical protein
MLTSIARREELLDEFERSGLSGPKFAALVGIKYSTFAAWAHRRKLVRVGTKDAKGSRSKGTPVQWLEAVVGKAQAAAPRHGSGLVLVLPGGARVELTASEQVTLAAELLRALTGPC